MRAHQQGKKIALPETVSYLAGTVLEDPFLDVVREDLTADDLLSFEVLDSLMAQRANFVATQALGNLEANARRMEVDAKVGGPAGFPGSSAWAP